MKIDCLFFDAGGGHRAAATALKSVVEQQRRPWQVRLVDVGDILAPIDIFRKTIGLGLEDIYNLLLKKGWTLGSTQLLPLMHAVIRLYHGKQVRLLAEHWRADTPDMVVSLIPNFGRAVYEGFRRVSPDAPFATVLTDLADYPPHVWMERQPQYYVCGSERAEQQAYEMGHPPERVFRVSGMVLRPAFYEARPLDRAAERKRLGLEPDLPTGLVLFGGQGASVMQRIATRLAGSGQRMQLILIAGHNTALAEKLRRMRAPIPMHVEGFTKEIPYYMRLADFFIGKPGPGSISEALAMRLPVIVERNAWTLPQERYNAEWIRERGLGMVLPTFRKIDEAVTELLRPGVLEGLRARAAEIGNRAVFEIPDILEKILVYSAHRDRRCTDEPGYTP